MKIDQATTLYGVIGHPLGHTLSPLLHNLALSRTSQNAVYLAFETREAAGAVNAMRALGIRGLSVTLPLKQAVMPFLDEIDPLAARIGAVNTIANRLGRLSGYNTDAPGALQAIGEVMDPAGCRVLILGAGGAARAAGMALKEVGARLTIANRSAARGSRLAGDLDAQWVPLAEAGAIECDLMLQATSVGMHPQVDLSPLGPGTIRAAVVMDMIYNPRETRLLADARRQGVRIIPGWRMFMYQAALQFRLWTGAEPPMEAMAQALAEALERP